ncbi:transmembrane protein 213 [Cavia porcellus]
MNDRADRGEKRLLKVFFGQLATGSFLEVTVRGWSDSEQGLVDFTPAARKQVLSDCWTERSREVSLSAHARGSKLVPKTRSRLFPVRTGSVQEKGRDSPSFLCQRSCSPCQPGASCGDSRAFLGSTPSFPGTRSRSFPAQDFPSQQRGAHAAHPVPRSLPLGMGSARLTSAPRAALLLSLVLASCSPDRSEARSSRNSTLTAPHADPGTLEHCSNIDFCPQAARCCRSGVDEYGWIAAAVGWSLWFLTLILLCVDKLMKLTPEESKDLRA